MKRSHEDKELNTSDENCSSEKRLKISDSSINDSDSNINDSDSSINDSFIQNYSVEEDCEEEDPFCSLEKQVVNKALAMVGKTNPHDWNYETSPENVICMDLLDTLLIDNNTYYTVSVSVYYDNYITGIKIYYYSQDKTCKQLDLIWQTYGFDDKLTIIRYNTSWWFWTEKEKINIYPENTKEHSWCYFQDIRSHLQYIDILF